MGTALDFNVQEILNCIGTTLATPTRQLGQFNKFISSNNYITTFSIERLKYVFVREYRVPLSLSPVRNILDCSINWIVTYSLIELHDIPVADAAHTSVTPQTTVACLTRGIT